MEVDAYFALGKSHTVCQDYAGVQGTGMGVRVAVSDGCSSSPDTDFGARFLVKATLGSLAYSLPHPKFVASQAADAANVLGLPSNCLDATLLVAEVQEDVLNVVAYGDGVIDVLFKDWTRKTYSIEFQNEAPAYPSYFLRPEDLKTYLTQYGTRKITIDNSEKDLLQLDMSKVTRDVYGFNLSVPWKDVRRVTLCSDGVRSFRKLTPPGTFESVTLQEVLTEVNNIKSTAGAFMVRRMRRFLYDFCPKNGWFHDDDVAVATILNTDAR